jgi:hypothetical protein
MGVFLLCEGTHQGFDKHMARFFWEGVGDKKKYHWLKWGEVCKPKDLGGLGIINSSVLNASLLLKWLWRLL